MFELNFRKELDEALKPILQLPVDIQDIVAKDLLETVKSRVAFMQSVAAKDHL